MTTNLEFPSRYEPLARLGTGGGGEVWAVRDRHNAQRFALKVLAADATEDEMVALVREAVALSGLEGLGVPRVRLFGRLPGSGRPFMVREMVEGVSLQHLIDDKTTLSTVLGALARAAEQLTEVHRAGFFHGDIKPANIIVEDSGQATLVDLGLAAPWRDTGTAARGLTPKYAAPELFQGGPLTVRAEVYALGVALSEAVLNCSVSADAARIRKLQSVADRARHPQQTERFPSADEFASALRSAAGLPKQTELLDPAGIWPIVGIEATASRLIGHVTALPPGGSIVVTGAEGSGRSVLLRRLAWSLGVEGRRLAWIDESMIMSPSAVQTELAAHGDWSETYVLVDDAESLSDAAVGSLRKVRKQGARLVLVEGGELVDAAQVFEVPPIGEHAALELVKRAIPSLTDPIAERLVEVSQGRPGELRRIVQRIASAAVVSEDDVEQVLSGLKSISPSMAPADPTQQAMHFLDRGRYNEARAALETLRHSSELDVVVARARLEVALGDAHTAIKLLQDVAPEAERLAGTDGERRWRLWLARAQIGVGEYTSALESLQRMSSSGDAIGFEAQTYEGLALSHVGEGESAEDTLDQAITRARQAGEHRVAGLSLTCLGLVLQRADDSERAREAYQQAVAEAQAAGDAGTLGTVQLNLAVLLKVGGDLAGALEHFEAAVDMGRRSGRRSTLRNALLNLANLDLYLGRMARARASIEALEEQREQLPAASEAQLLGLRAELSGRTGDVAAGIGGYQECASAYEELGRNIDAAEARLEGVLLVATSPDPDINELNRVVARAKAELGDGPTHRSMLLLATARVLWVAGDEMGARQHLDDALKAARETQHRDWIWRTLETRADIEASSGQPLMARRDREEALTILESIAARLPRDLREVFWNDPRRRALRSSVESSLGHAATHVAPVLSDTTQTATGSSVSEISKTPLEQGLARILEVNSELLGELDLKRLTGRVVEYAVDLLKAERGFLLLREPNGELSVHTSRDRHGDEAHAEFSRSIAQKVISTQQPVISLNALSDSRMRGYASVHQLMVETVACVPVAARGAKPLGALYVEARQDRARHLERDVPTLRAFGDQVALAIETARLISENARRADELEETNAKLEEAQARLKELLGDRTQKLNQARRKLRAARDTLYGHFGYQGMVGTSEAMRRVYALIDRVKDTDVPVLITGESGTGKEVAARAIHQASQRSKRPFLGVNCGALPQHLLESELFGHVRGAFTGADRERKGLIREAVGGTVLLDEIGEMSPKMQAGLLRALQENRVRPVGGTHEESVDVRFIFATHRDLAGMVKEGTFREDLYYRVHVVELAMPPLRERTEDIAPLVDHFFGIFAARYKRDKRTLSRDAMRRLAGFHWPGNVRQLEHVLLNAWVLCDDSEVDAEDLDLPDGAEPAAYAVASTPAVERTSPSETSQHGASPSSKRETLSRHRRSERQAIIDALKSCNWNRVKAAELVGMPRRTFYRRLKQYKIQ